MSHSLTHWHGCEQEHGHHACALAELARLRAELERVNRRLADAKTAIVFAYGCTGPHSHLRGLALDKAMAVFADEPARAALAQEPPK